MRRRNLAFSLFLAASTVLADGPATQPDVTIPADQMSSDSPADATPNDRPNDRPNAGGPNGDRPNRPERPRRGMGQGNFGGGGFGGFGPGGFRGMRMPGANGERPLAELQRKDGPSDEEWEKISKFSQDNFPNRWKMFERVRDTRGEDAPVVTGLKLVMANRYRALMKAQTDMPDAYEAALEQGKREDNAWGLAQQVQADADNQDLRNQLRDAVTQLVKASLDDRAARLKSARETLEHEQQQYDNDVQNMEDTIDRRMSRLVNVGAAFDGNPTTAPTTQK